MHASDESEKAKPARTKRSRRGVAISPKDTPVTRRQRKERKWVGGGVRERERARKTLRHMEQSWWCTRDLVSIM
jgi:hypothetical protein